MTTITQARETVYQAFATAWGGTTAYCFGNEQFTPPANAAFVRVTMQHFTGNQESLGPTGARKFLREGQIVIQVFTPQNVGHASSDSLVQSARAVYEGKTLFPGTVRCIGANVSEVGVDDGYLQVNIEIPFNYDETK